MEGSPPSANTTRCLNYTPRVLSNVWRKAQHGTVAAARLTALLVLVYVFQHDNPCWANRCATHATEPTYISTNTGSAMTNLTTRGDKSPGLPKWYVLSIPPDTAVVLKSFHHTSRLTEKCVAKQPVCPSRNFADQRLRTSFFYRNTPFSCAGTCVRGSASVLVSVKGPVLT